MAQANAAGNSVARGTAHTHHWLGREHRQLPACDTLCSAALLPPPKPRAGMPRALTGAAADAACILASPAADSTRLGLCMGHHATLSTIHLPACRPVCHILFRAQGSRLNTNNTPHTPPHTHTTTKKTKLVHGAYKHTQLLLLLPAAAAATAAALQPSHCRCCCCVAAAAA